MRHLKHRHQLGRKKEHRQAMMGNLAAALLRHGRIQTTLPKAKALRPFVEKIITLAKKAEGATPESRLHLQRLAVSRVRDKEAVSLLFREKAGMFSDRPGGYTRIYKLGTRIGDAAEMAVIQLIPAEDEGYPRKSKAAKKPAKTEAPAPQAEAESVPEEVAPESVPAEESEPVAEDTPAEEAPEKKE